MSKQALILVVMGIIGSLNAVADATRAEIEPFYEFLSNPSSPSYAGKLSQSLASSWVSIGDYSGFKKSRDKFIGQVTGFGKLIPDLNWAIEDVIVDGNQVVVRSRATGTPQGPLFGVDGKGKSFDIMTIDIHTIKDGKVLQTYHVEDWAGALRQLKFQ